MIAESPSRQGGDGDAGRLAQLAEHLVYTEGVGGSSPSSPTTGLGFRSMAATSA